MWNPNAEIAGECGHPPLPCLPKRIQNDNKKSEPKIRFALIFILKNLYCVRAIQFIDPILIYHIFSLRAVEDASPYALAQSEHQVPIICALTGRCGQRPLQICRSGYKAWIAYKLISGIGPCGRAPRPCLNILIHAGNLFELFLSHCSNIVRR